MYPYGSKAGKYKGMVMIFESNSEQETFDFARELAAKANKGDIYALIGDLGVGKTAFTKGFAKGLNIDEPIVSPTFTFVQVYDEGTMPLYHFDVYRIGDSSEMEEIGYEDYFYGDGVSLMEWANLVEELLPEDTIWITISKDLSKGLDYRRIEITGGED